MRITAIRVALATLLAMLLTGVGASAASAHSDTFSSIPAAGSTSASVTQIQFTFAEPVQKSMGPEVVLSTTGGVTVPLGAPTFDVTGATMTVAITSGALPNGSYGAVYRVVSIDGHVASGVLNFTVAGSNAAPLAGTSPKNSAVTVPEQLQPSNDVPVLTLIMSIAAVVLILAAVIVVIVRRRQGKL